MNALRNAIRGKRRHGSGRSPMAFAAYLAVLPFVLLSFMAPGTMTVSDADGLPKIVICTGDGPLEMVVGEDGSLQLPGDRPADRDGHDCAWAFHGQSALDLSIPVFPAAVVLRVPVKHVVSQDQIRQRPNLFTGLARAPPADLA
jgi:hypothetical protein